MATKAEIRSLNDFLAEKTMMRLDSSRRITKEAFIITSAVLLGLWVGASFLRREDE